MGSRFKMGKEIEKAYIAGFLDGDGSLMLQLKKRSDSKREIRFMATICFYQDTRHDKTLSWIRKILGKGYLSKRNDGMSELRVNGFESIADILQELLPFIRFKKIQAKALHTACTILSEKSFKKLSRKELLKIVGFIMVIQSENYATKKKKTKQELLTMLDLTP